MKRLLIIEEVVGIRVRTLWVRIAGKNSPENVGILLFLVV